MFDVCAKQYLSTYMVKLEQTCCTLAMGDQKAKTSSAINNTV